MFRNADEVLWLLPYLRFQKPLYVHFFNPFDRLIITHLWLVSRLKLIVLTRIETHLTINVKISTKKKAFVPRSIAEDEVNSVLCIDLVPEINLSKTNLHADRSGCLFHYRFFNIKLCVIDYFTAQIAWFAMTRMLRYSLSD